MSVVEVVDVKFDIRIYGVEVVVFLVFVCEYIIIYVGLIYDGVGKSFYYYCICLFVFGYGLFLYWIKG